MIVDKSYKNFLVTQQLICFVYCFASNHTSFIYKIIFVFTFNKMGQILAVQFRITELMFLASQISENPRRNISKAGSFFLIKQRQVINLTVNFCWDHVIVLGLLNLKDNPLVLFTNMYFTDFTANVRSFFPRR